MVARPMVSSGCWVLNPTLQARFFSHLCSPARHNVHGCWGSRLPPGPDLLDPCFSSSRLCSLGVPWNVIRHGDTRPHPRLRISSCQDHQVTCVPLTVREAPAQTAGASPC